MTGVKDGHEAFDVMNDGPTGSGVTKEQALYDGERDIPKDGHEVFTMPDDSSMIFKSSPSEKRMEKDEREVVGGTVIIDNRYEPTDDRPNPEETDKKAEKAIDSIERTIKDSGTRTEFETGAVRDGREDKGRFDLLPMLTLFRLAKHYDRGCLKYGDRNWEKGIPLSKYWDSAIRHMLKAMMGFTDESHMTSALWNIACFMETRDRITLGLLPPSLYDIPNSFSGVDYDMFERLLDQLL